MATVTLKSGWQIPLPCRPLVIQLISGLDELLTGIPESAANFVIHSWSHLKLLDTLFLQDTDFSGLVVLSRSHLKLTCAVIQLVRMV